MRRLAFILGVMICGSGPAWGDQMPCDSATAATNSVRLFANYQPLAGNSHWAESSPPLLLDAEPAPTPAPSPEPAPAPGPQVYYVQSEPVYRRPWVYEGSVSAGYSNIRFPHARSPAFYDTSGGYIDANFAFSLPKYSSPIIGFGITGSGYFSTRNDVNVGTLFSDVDMISFEARIAAPIPADGGHGFFLLPRLGGGLLINDYAIDSPGGVNTIFTSFHDGVGVEVRPSIELGYRWSRDFSAGIEGSYMAAWGDFGSLGSLAQEWRVGFVFSYRF